MVSQVKSNHLFQLTFEMSTNKDKNNNLSVCLSVKLGSRSKVKLHNREEQQETTFITLFKIHVPISLVHFSNQ